MRFFRQHSFNTRQGPFYESEAGLPEEPPASSQVQLIAYYLPQFHAIPENNRWWGEGFTEWTNVTKAVPRYIGHRQPNLPADLGFYDLKLLDVLRRQASLARRGGITAFCLHNYWFSGQHLLEAPLRLILANRDIDLSFCLNWANESWTRRWDGRNHDILMEQGYQEGDESKYANAVAPAMRDPRYFRVNGRPLLMIYRPGEIPDAPQWIARLREAIKSEGLGDPYLVMPQVFQHKDPQQYGLDAAAGFPPHNGGFDLRNDRSRLDLLDRDFEGHAASYLDLAERTLENGSANFRLFPGVCPRWDNEARRPGRGFGFYGSTPARYGKWLKAAMQYAARAPQGEQIVFINAWNEWAEGAYLEPDQHFGYSYLKETRRVLDAVEGRSILETRDEGEMSVFTHPVLSQRSRVINKLYRLARSARKVGT